MPSEVIMPALGMAQDTGKLTAWLKQPGDAVAEGDVLFEVETDKSTMEVEAQATGFLTGVTARAGEDVPVGQVIAMISDTADESAAPATAAAPPDAAPAAADPAPAPASAAAAAPDLPDGREVIMPALGMAQDTGLLVAWHKAPGDAVAADDVLFDVETDKSTMEVAAGADGYLAALLAEPGEAIPTGQTIAIISPEKPGAPVVRSAAAGGAPAAAAPAAQAPPDTAEAPPAQSPAQAPAQAPLRQDGRILASPKARRLAMEEGLDLGRLVAAGHPQPYHASDIAVLRALPPPDAAAPVAAALAPVAAAGWEITASVPRAGTAEFVAWMLEDGGITIAPAALWVSFAAGALRAAAAMAGDVVVAHAPLGGGQTRWLNADRTRLLHQAEAPEGPVDLVLRDLTDSRLTGLRTGPDTVPVLTIAGDGDALRLSLGLAADQLDEATAIALLTGFADRLADPLHYLI